MNEDCAKIRPLLDAWIDGALSSFDRRRVARHVEICSNCGKEVESRRGVDAAIAADDQADDPGDAYSAALDDRINTRFDFEEAARHWAKPEKPARTRRVKMPRVWIPRLAFGVAGISVATVAVLLVRDLGPIHAPLPRITDLAEIPAARDSGQDGVAASRPTDAGQEAPTRSERPAAPPGESTIPRPVPGAATPSASREASDFEMAAKASAGEGRKEHPETGSAPESLAAAADSTPPGSTPPDSAPPSRPGLLAFFGALVEPADTRPSVTSRAEIASVAQNEQQSTRDDGSQNQFWSRRPAGSQTKDAIPAGPRRDQAAVPADSTWIRLRQGEARAAADAALAAGSIEGCEAALRAYWNMIHRGGRLLLSSPRDRAQLLEPDRPRIERLLRCAAR